MKQIADKIFDDLKEAYANDKKVSDEIMSQLVFTFPNTLQAAFEIVDHRSITKVTCPAGRCVFQVRGSSGTPYSCLPSSDYCNCPAFEQLVIDKEEIYMCKHVLAVRLSEAMGLSFTRHTTNQGLGDLILEL